TGSAEAPSRRSSARQQSRAARACSRCGSARTTRQVTRHRHSQGVVMVAFNSLFGLRGMAAGLLAAAWLMATPLASQAQDDKAVDEMMAQAQRALQKGQPREAESLLRKAIEAAP